MRRIHLPDHLAFIRTLPCLTCLDNTSTEAAHVRLSDERAAKVNPGVGQKPHDFWTVPLCGNCHRHQHEVGEIEFWDMAAIDPLAVSLFLYACALANADDSVARQEAGERIIQAQHR